MMARGLAYLLIPLGLSCVKATLPTIPGLEQFTKPQQIAESGCKYRLDKCLTAYAESAGEKPALVCDFFTVFVTCYEKHIGLCDKENGEAAEFESKYDRIVRRLPTVIEGGCKEYAPRLVERKDFFPSSDNSVPDSSVITLPGSGTSGGNPSGSSLFYANWWQWLVLISCVCCCFLAAGGVCASRRRRYGSPGYYEDPYLQPPMQYNPQQAMAYDPQQVYMVPEQVVPLTGYNPGYNQATTFPLQNQGYSANMPTTFAMQQPGYY